MPLKPVYARAPLMAEAYAALPETAVFPRGWLLAKLQPLENALQKLPQVGQTLIAEAGLAFFLNDQKAIEKLRQTFQKYMDSQREDGSYAADSFADMLSAASAGRTLYSGECDKAVLESLMRFARFVNDHWPELRTRQQSRPVSGELLSLVKWLYNVTGKKALLKIADVVRADTIDWASGFHIFSAIKPTEKMISWADMESGVAAEKGDIGGLHTRQYCLTNGSWVAENLATPAVLSLFSGSGKEKEAGLQGVEKLTRYHGVASGVFTADDFLAGANPSCYTNTLSIGAYVRSLAELLCVGGELSLADDMERAAFNALAAAWQEDKVQAMQAVNQVKESKKGLGCYHARVDTAAFMTADKEIPSAAALAMGYAAYAKSIALLNPEQELCVMSYAPCDIRWQVKGVPIRLQIEGEYPRSGDIRITVTSKRAVRFALNLRVPAYAQDAQVCAGDGVRVKAAAGTMLRLEQTWKTGDVITLTLPMHAKVEQWYHQSAAITVGPLLMALPVAKDEPWAVAVNPKTVGEVKKGPLVKIKGKELKTEWPNRERLAAPPIAPETTGREKGYELVPFADTKCRIAQFPVLKDGWK